MYGILGERVVSSGWWYIRTVRPLSLSLARSLAHSLSPVVVGGLSPPQHPLERLSQPYRTHTGRTVPVAVQIAL